MKLLKTLVAFASLMALSTTIHAQGVEEKWTEVLYLTGSGGFAVPGDEGQYVGVWEVRGLARFEDGSVAKIQSAGTLDFERGIGPYSGYVLYTFEDGSSKFVRLEGVVTELTPDGGNLQEGSLAFESGTGRFSGIEGSGSYRARQYGPANEGGETIVEAVARYSLPN